jgi:hypothetical protein
MLTPKRMRCCPAATQGCAWRGVRCWSLTDLAFLSVRNRRFRGLDLIRDASKSPRDLHRRSDSSRDRIVIRSGERRHCERRGRLDDQLQCLARRLTRARNSCRHPRNRRRRSPARVAASEQTGRRSSARCTKLALSYVATTTETMLLAAELWAVARQEGRPAADEKALDGDVILAAQTRLLAVPRNENHRRHCQRRSHSSRRARRSVAAHTVCLSW